MIDLILKCRYNMFINAARILPEPSTISELLDIYKDHGFIPGTLQFLGSEGPTLRLRMTSSALACNIAFLPDRIAIEQSGGTGQQEIAIDSFLTLVDDLADRAFTYLGHKSSRLALIVNSMCKEMTPEKLQSCYTQVFVPFSIYQSNPSFEWNNRSICRQTISLDSQPEEVNVIIELKRMQAQVSIADKAQSVDRIFFNYEFNTIAENTGTRFSTKEIECFANKARESYDAVMADVEGVLDA